MCDSADTVCKPLQSIALKDPEERQDQVPKQPGLKPYCALQSFLKLGHNSSRLGHRSNKQCSNLPVSCTSNSASSSNSDSDSGMCVSPAAGLQLHSEGSGADTCEAGIDICTSSWTSNNSTDKQAAAPLLPQDVPSSSGGCQELAAGRPTKPRPRARSLQRAGSAQVQWLKRLSYSALRPAHVHTDSRAATLLPLQRLALSAKLPAALTARCSRAPRQRNTSLPPLSFSSRASPQKRQRRATSFQATGRENIRVLLGPNAVCGSITRYKMLLLAEKVHEAHLQTVLDQTVEQVDWAGEPAWAEDFSMINSTYAQRVRQCLFWWGGALTRLSWGSAGASSSTRASAAQQQVDQGQEGQEGGARMEGQEAGSPGDDADADDDDDGEVAGAQVAVLVAGEEAFEGAAAAAVDAVKKKGA